MLTLRTLGLYAVIPALLVLGGCSGASTAEPAASTGGGGAVPVAANGSRAEDKTADYSNPDGVPEGQPADFTGTVVAQIARTASAGLSVTDVEEAATKLRSIATAMGGLVTSENLITRVDAKGISSPISTMVITVPSDKLDSTLEQLKSVGTITTRVISSDDVTTQVADVESRIKALNSSIARLNELSKKAGSISDLTELEGELTRRIEERDSLVAQQKSLAGRVAQSPITITLNTPATIVEPELPGFMSGLVAGWNALISSSRVLLTIVGALLPFLVVIAAIGAPLLVWRRRNHGRANITVPATTPPTEPKE
jgi:hypothetical protein